MKIDSETLDHVFKYHKPTADQAQRYEALREAAKRFATQIVGLCPHSEERSVALRDLQRCVMMANASIALNEDTTKLEMPQPGPGRAE